MTCSPPHLQGRARETPAATGRRPRRAGAAGALAGALILVAALIAQERDADHGAWEPFARIVAVRPPQEAIAPSDAARYRIDFEHHWYASVQEEQAERARLATALTALEGLRGSVMRSALALRRAFELYDQVQILFNRLYSYFYLRYAVDTENRSALAASETLAAEVDERTAFLRQEVVHLGGASLDTFLAEQPALRKYAFGIEAMRRWAPYTLSPAEESLLSASAASALGWQFDLYDRLRARLPPSPAAASGDRGTAFKARYQAVRADRELYALALTRLAAARDLWARRRHFADAPTEAYFDRYLTRMDVDRLVARIAERADIYKEYERARAAHVKVFGGFDEVNVWDLTFRPPTAPSPRFTIAQATEVIRAATAPLGTEYGRELAALLDPANGRMDIVPGPHRRRGGFSRGFIGTDSVFYSQGFSGEYNDVRVLMHESTHAVQRQLMNRHQVLPTYATGPSFLFEAFAIFNELLLPEYLRSREADPVRKQYYLEQFLAGKGLELFVVAPEVALEHAVYDGVRNGTVRDADDLDALTKAIYSRFSVWPERHDELKTRWVDIQLMYEDPFYDTNYVYGALLALTFYDMYTRDAAGFVPRYVALMQNGFDAAPDALLQRSLTVDLRDERLLANAVAILTGKVRQLEESYRRP